MQNIKLQEKLAVAREFTLREQLARNEEAVLTCDSEGANLDGLIHGREWRITRVDLTEK